MNGDLEMVITWSILQTQTLQGLKEHLSDEYRYHGYPLIAQKLLESGAQVDAVNQSGQTAIMLAAAKGYQETTKLLHQYSASIDTKDFNERNPLIHAASNGKVWSFSIFLNKERLSVNALDLQGNGGTALIHAARGGHSMFYVYCWKKVWISTRLNWQKDVLLWWKPLFVGTEVSCSFWSRGRDESEGF